MTPKEHADAAFRRLLHPTAGDQIPPQDAVLAILAWACEASAADARAAALEEVITLCDVEGRRCMRSQSRQERAYGGLAAVTIEAAVRALAEAVGHSPSDPR